MMLTLLQAQQQYATQPFQAHGRQHKELAEVKPHLLVS
jgi:hypothetical protein